MSALLYRGVGYRQPFIELPVDERQSPVELVYRRSTYRAARRAAAQHTKTLTYRGHTYCRGVSYADVAAQWL